MDGLGYATLVWHGAYVGIVFVAEQYLSSTVQMTADCSIYERFRKLPPAPCQPSPATVILARKNAIVRQSYSRAPTT